jgi:hypothetical protein
MTRTVQTFFESTIKKKNLDRDTIRFVLIQAIFFISPELRKDLTGQFGLKDTIYAFRAMMVAIPFSSSSNSSVNPIDCR